MPQCIFGTCCVPSWCRPIMTVKPGTHRRKTHSRTENRLQKNKNRKRCDSDLRSVGLATQDNSENLNKYTIAWAACRNFYFCRWNESTWLKQCLLLAVEKQKENTRWKKLNQAQIIFCCVSASAKRIEHVLSFHFSHSVFLSVLFFRLWVPGFTEVFCISVFKCQNHNL